MVIWKETKAGWKFLMFLEMRHPELRQGCSLSESPKPDWTACAGPHNALVTPRWTFPYRTHLLCSHSWSGYQRVVCMSPVSLPAGAGWNMNKIWCWSREPEQMSGSPFHQHTQLSTAWQNWLLSCSVLLAFFMTLFKILKPGLLQTLTHLLGSPNAQAPFAPAEPCQPSPTIPSAPATGKWQQIPWDSTSLASAFLIRMGRGELQ